MPIQSVRLSAVWASSPCYGHSCDGPGLSHGAEQCHSCDGPDLSHGAEQCADQEPSRNDRLDSSYMADFEAKRAVLSVSDAESEGAHLSSIEVALALGETPTPREHKLLEWQDDRAPLARRWESEKALEELAREEGVDVKIDAVRAAVSSQAKLQRAVVVAVDELMIGPRRGSGRAESGPIRRAVRGQLKRRDAAECGRASFTLKRSERFPTPRRV